jgi:dienelactone hydrolase
MLLACGLCACSGGLRSHAAREQAAARVEHTTFRLQGEEVSVHLPPSPASQPLPGVLLFHSAMGRTPSVMHAADLLAAEGFAVYALDFYFGKTASTRQEALSLRDEANRHVGPENVLVKEAFKRLGADPRIRASCRFLVGWSYGGAWATHSAGELPEASGVVAFYGEGFSDSRGLYERVRAPMLLIGASRDTEPSPGTLEEIGKNLTARGVNASVVLLDAEHGFAERAHSGYQADAAEKALDLAVEFLKDQVRKGCGRQPGA